MGVVEPRGHHGTVEVHLGVGPQAVHLLVEADDPPVPDAEGRGAGPDRVHGDDPGVADEQVEHHGRAGALSSLLRGRFHAGANLTGQSVPHPGVRRSGGVHPEGDSVCDSMVTITPDGVLFAKNSDRDPNEAQLLEWVAGRRPRCRRAVACTWIDVPQAAHTHAVLLSRPWWMWGAEMGANEHGVVIGNEAVFTTASPGTRHCWAWTCCGWPWSGPTTAEAAVSVMVELLERHGQGGPCSYERPGFTYDNSFLVADPDRGRSCWRRRTVPLGHRAGGRAGAEHLQRADHPGFRPGPRPGRSATWLSSAPPGGP